MSEVSEVQEGTESSKSPVPVPNLIVLVGLMVLVWIRAVVTVVLHVVVAAAVVVNLVLVAVVEVIVEVVVESEVEVGVRAVVLVLTVGALVRGGPYWGRAVTS